MEENLKNVPDQTSGLKKFKINKTMLLVVGLILLTVLLLVISLSSKNSSPITSIARQEEKDLAHTSLSISEEPRTGSVSGTYEVDINIDSSDNKVTGAQLELSYDPKVLTKVDIKAGDFIPNAQVILKKVDTQNGRISYVIGSQLGDAGIKGIGQIAIISFSKTSDQETPIEFLPQTLITAEGSDQSVLKESISGMVGILPAKL